LKKEIELCNLPDFANYLLVQPTQEQGEVYDHYTEPQQMDHCLQVVEEFEEGQQGVE
jgi:hypothetical protein